MASPRVKLGYELGTGKVVDIPLSHLMVTGLSQQSGKTTTLESLITRSKKRAIVFRTKIGEKGFMSGTIIPPYFKDKSDWQFIESLINAVMNEKIHRDERASIIKLSKQTNGESLLDFKKQVDQRLLEKKIGKWEENTLTNLQAYLDIVLPKLQSVNFSNTLELSDGLNIIDLERFSRDDEVQSLIIASVLEEVLHNFKDVIVVIPEAWKFIPQGKGNPCKQSVEEYIRQGATNNNYIWIDSQDIAGVDKIPLKQISEWILGYQAEINEVKHTIAQLPLPKAKKPEPDLIMSLGKGKFYYASRDLTTQVYVQPFWLDDEKSIQIAKGELSIDDIDAPQSLSSFKIATKTTESDTEVVDVKETSKRFSKELVEMRTDFFNKIQDIQSQILDVISDVYNLKMEKPELDMDEILSYVLQKMPTPAPATGGTVDTESIIKAVLARVPKGGSVTYTVAPLEKIKQDFIQASKDKIISGFTELSDDAKKMCKYAESRATGVTANEFVTKCFMLSPGTPQSNKIKKGASELGTIGVLRNNSHGKYMPELKTRINELLSPHNTTQEEKDNLYNHILMELV